MSAKADSLNTRLTEKLANARGVVMIAQGYADDDDFRCGLQAALDLLDEVDDLAAGLARLAGATNT